MSNLKFLAQSVLQTEMHRNDLCGARS